MDDWVPVWGFRNYSVSPLGQVRNDLTGRILTPRITQYGTVYVGMMRDWRQQQRSLALLVARHFLEGKSDIFNTPINLDGDRFNCHVDNLMWRPLWFARRYNQQFHGLTLRLEVPIRCRNSGEEFPDSLSAAMRYGLLEKDVVLSIEHNTVTWPTYQSFELVE